MGRAQKKYVSHVPHATASARLVSAADKLHNSRSIVRDLRATGSEVWGRFHASRDEVLWYYRALVGAFREVGSNALVEEFDRVVSEMERLAASAK